MPAGPVLVSFVTPGSSPGAAANNKSRALSAAFAELDIAYDAVYLEDPAGVEHTGSTRRVRLGSVRARSSIAPLARYLREARPALTIASPHYVAPFAVVAGAVARSPVVPWEVTLLSRDLGKDSDWPTSFRSIPLLQKLTYRLAPWVAVDSWDVGAELVRDGKVRDRERVRFLPDPVDVSKVRELAHPPVERGGRFRFCAVGRLARQKAYDLMIDGFAHADGRLPDWELVILGNGPRLHELQGQVRRLGLERKISFVGHHENPYPFMAGSDVFVHSARWEGSPIVVTEALALELPVVAVDGAGGAREILDGGHYGLLVAPEDPEALAEALVGMATDEALRREFSSRALAATERYSGSTVARRLCDLAGELSS